MKCIKLIDGTVKRVPDVIAYNTVKNGMATYVTKSEWKKHGYSNKGIVTETEVVNVSESPKLSKEERQKEKKQKYKAEKKKILSSQKSKK